MIGNLVRGYKIIESIKTVEIDERLKDLLYNLAHIQGRSNGMTDIFDYIAENIEMQHETYNKIYDDSVDNLIKRIREVIGEIQSILEIGNKFFICDINKNIINIFDLSYEDDFFSYKNTIYVCDDFKRIIIENE